MADFRRPLLRMCTGEHRHLISELCGIALFALLGRPHDVAAASTAAIPVAIELRWAPQKDGVLVSVDTPGETSGLTVLENESCCGITDAAAFISELTVSANGMAVPLERVAQGWRVRHSPGSLLNIRYRLPATPAMQVVGTDQYRPSIHAGTAFLIGRTALVLPKRPGDTAAVLELDASALADEAHVVSSFGPGNRQRAIATNWDQMRSALYLGGAIDLHMQRTAQGTLGIVFSAMQAGFDSTPLVADIHTIVASERRFFGNGQPWYLVSMHGGDTGSDQIHIGGGTGLTNAFVMFPRADLDADDDEQREHVRWTLAHEYFHQWNGLTIRVATLPGSEEDDTSVYWFSEGITEFYAHRLLQRAGLQTAERSLAVLDDKLRRYASNRWRDSSAAEAGKQFWSDGDGSDLPYLRGYIAALFVDTALQRASRGKTGLDDRMRALLRRARDQPGFRVDNRFLVALLSKGMHRNDAKALRTFVIAGDRRRCGRMRFRRA